MNTSKILQLLIFNELFYTIHIFFIKFVDTPHIYNNKTVSNQLSDNLQIEAAT